MKICKLEVCKLKIWVCKLKVCNMKFEVCDVKLGDMKSLCLEVHVLKICLMKIY